MGKPYGNHNHLTHGKRHTRLYRIWANIKTRCFNTNDLHYKRWGALGITMCDEWKNNFQAFYNWAMSNGYADDLTIDRIDNYGNYEPSNCRWVTVKEQNQNKKNVVLLTYNGLTLSCREWAKMLGIGKNTVRERYNKGWTVEECLYGKKGVINLCLCMNIKRKR